MIDAGHNGYYVAGYCNKVLSIPPRYITGDELRKIKKGYKLYSYAKIDGLKTAIVSPLKGLICYAEENGGKAAAGGELFPVYCRKSQAEENR